MCGAGKYQVFVVVTFNIGAAYVAAKLQACLFGIEADARYLRGQGYISHHLRLFGQSAGIEVVNFYIGGISGFGFAVTILHAGNQVDGAIARP